MTLPVAQRLTHKQGRFDQISVAADDGVSATALKRRIAEQMPAGVGSRRRKENADRGSEEIRDNLGFLRIFLLVFGFIAVFVGSFLIFNTFSITVAQRVSEFGMLRTLGASRRQILTTVMVESLAIGLLGAVLGIGGGFLIAKAINALFVAFGIDLPTTGLVLEPRTVVVSLLVGVARHPRLLAGPGAALDPGAADRRPARLPAAADPPAPPGLPGALGPARRSPAWRWSCRPLRRRQRRRPRPALIGGGAVAVVFAVSLFSPRLVPPLAVVAGWPLERLRRLTGRLARENAQRNPSRTAVTAAALMIGVALVAFVTVFAAGLKSTVAQVVDENFAGGLVIQNTDGFSPIPTGDRDGRRGKCPVSNW